MSIRARNRLITNTLAVARRRLVSQRKYLADARERVRLHRERNPLKKLKNGYAPVDRTLPKRHQHTCVAPSCKKTYSCENACDPVGEGLANSICDGCLQEAQTP
jgi:hypothetical protein